MIVDIILAVVILLFAALGVYRGAAKTILSFAAVLIAACAAFILSEILAEVIFDAFLRQAIADRISQSLTQAYANETAGLSASIIEAIPTYAVSALSYFGVTDASLESYCSDAVAAASDKAAISIADALRPSVTGAVASMLSIVLFVILLVVLLWVAKLLSRVFTLPLIRTVDSILGVAVGLIQGLIIVAVSAALMSLVLPMLPPSTSSVIEGYMKGSDLLSVLHGDVILSWFQQFVYNSENMILG